MSYIDVWLDRQKDIVHVVERINGQRIFREFLPEYSFYYPSNNGRFTSTFGVKLEKYQTHSYKKFNIEKKSHDASTLHEADIRPVFKVLENEYKDAPYPNLQTAGFDIEADFCPKRGFAPPEDPFNAITAITINYDWEEDSLITLVLHPKTMDFAQGQKIASKFKNTILCKDEAELLTLFLELVEPVDVLYGWNSEGYDIPYIVNRITRVLGKDATKKLCFWNQLPSKREYDRGFGKKEQTFDLIGRVHLDYMQLYKKFTYHSQPSYRLGYIGQVEVNENKVEYDGTLDHLYNHDFEKFIEYNRQDVALLNKLNNKLQYIDLVNQLCHDNGVLFANALGTVIIVDQAIVREAHLRNMIVHPSSSREKFWICGAFVADPEQGISKWTGSIDLNSLYPSLFRTLNMSPETLVGQLLPEYTDEFISNRIKELKAAKKRRKQTEDDEESEYYSKAWSDLFCTLEFDEVMKKSKNVLKVWIESEKQFIEMTAKEVYEWIYTPESGLALSANGTIFRTDIDGIIPSLLERWYNERKDLQKTARQFEKQLVEIEKTLGKDSKEYKLKEEEYKFWDKRQHVKKILLNSLYGAVSNAASSFSDQRIGQSTTLSGRYTVKHMMAKVNEILTGEYNYQGKTITYGDTDSTYFTVEPVIEDLAKQGLEINRDTFVDLCDNIAEVVNESFVEYSQKSFNSHGKFSKVLKCGREICAERGLFIKKKHYAILYYDKEGKRTDIGNKPGEMKIMGLATQRSDTPEKVQDFLGDVLFKVLTGEEQDDVIKFIQEFRENFKDVAPWEMGTPKAVNKLSFYTAQYNKTKKCSVGHVLAAINWNKMRILNNDKHSMPITDGQKIIVCKLKPNQLKMTSIAYPIDEFNLPSWFKELPFDTKAMEETMIDTKLDNIIGILDWNLGMSKLSASVSDFFNFN